MYKKLLILLFSNIIFFSAIPAYGAKVFWEPKNAVLAPNGRITATLLLDSEDVHLNAFEGVISYDAKILELLSINTGGSSINYWINAPKDSTQKGEISFSGVTPGGYYGAQGKLFSLTFRARESGTSELSSNHLDILLNNGEGTKVNVDSIPLVVVIRDGGSIKLVSSFEEEIDTDIESPEIEAPRVVRDENLYDGKYVLLWNADDKGSGLSRVEVCEGRLPCEIVDGPYVLKNQNRTDEIALKAYDNRDNRTIVMLPPEADSPISRSIRPSDYKVFSAIFILGILAFFLFKFRRKN